MHNKIHVTSFVLSYKTCNHIFYNMEMYHMFLKFENPSSGSEVMMTSTHCGQTNRQTDRQTDLAVELTSPFGRGQLKTTLGHSFVTLVI